jgi:hypothetical protein
MKIARIPSGSGFCRTMAVLDLISRRGHGAARINRSRVPRKSHSPHWFLVCCSASARNLSPASSNADPHGIIRSQIPRNSHAHLLVLAGLDCARPRPSWASLSRHWNLIECCGRGSARNHSVTDSTEVTDTLWVRFGPLPHGTVGHPGTTRASNRGQRYGVDPRPSVPQSESRTRIHTESFGHGSDVTRTASDLCCTGLRSETPSQSQSDANSPARRIGHRPTRRPDGRAVTDGQRRTRISI